jgi:hypothetical protein
LFHLQQFCTVVGDKNRTLGFDKTHHRSQGLVDMGLLAADERYPENTALPGILLTHLGHRHIKAAFDPVNDSFDNPSFFFEGIGFPQEKLHSQNAYNQEISTL